MKPRTEHTRFGRNHKMGIGSFILLICFYVFVMYFVNPSIDQVLHEQACTGKDPDHHYKLKSFQI